MTRKITRPKRADRLDIALGVDRCPALYRDTMRPKLAAVEAARIARQPLPATDWQCIRPTHSDQPDAPTEHLATPLGIAGPSYRFSGDQVDPGPEPTPEPDPAAASEHVLHLVDQLARRGAGVVRAAAGDTLVLLVPDGDALLEPDPDDPTAERVDAASAIVGALAAALPGVAVLVLSGVTGAVVVPAPTGPTPISDADAGEFARRVTQTAADNGYAVRLVDDHTPARD